MIKSKCSSKKAIGGKPHKETNKSSNSNGKTKESKTRPPNSPGECSLSFPEMNIVDKDQLPIFYQVLSRSKDDGVVMDDLGRLQLELETLLSGVSVRIRDLSNEIATLNIAEERRDKKIKLALTTSRKKADEKKNREPAGKTRPRIGTLDDPSALAGPELSMDHLQVLLPKNDIAHKFWLSVEPYCADITPEDVKFLKELKATCEKEAEIQKIPPLGRHYTLRWAEEDMMDERDGSAVVKLKRKPSEDVKDMLKKASKFIMKEKIPGPLIQRLVSALVDENYMHSQRDTTKMNKTSGDNNELCETPHKKIKLEDTSNAVLGENSVPNYIKKLPTFHTTACFELRIRKELESMGFIDPRDYTEEHDEILEEIKKCQEELRTTALHTADQLKQLISLAEVELKKSDVRKQLKQVEQEIVDVSKKITLAKQKKLPVSEEEKESAWALLTKRTNLLTTLKTIN